MDDIQKTVVIWTQAWFDISEGKSLERWEDDIDGAIAEVDKLIQNASGKIDGYLKLKNELFFLKYLIAETT